MFCFVFNHIHNACEFFFFFLIFNRLFSTEIYIKGAGIITQKKHNKYHHIRNENVDEWIYHSLRLN